MPLKSHPIKPTKVKKNLKELEDFKVEEKGVEVSDPQKEFFRLMAEKIKDDSDDLVAPATSVGQSTAYVGKVSYYRKMIGRFLILVLALFVAVFYFSIVKLDVVVKNEQKSIDDSLNFYAYADNAQVNIDRAVKAGINRVELEVVKEFASTGQKNLSGQVGGKVKIINNYSKNQPLVATTRLLSADNKLFRIKNTVNVPAGGSVEVEVYADNNSADMAIAPGKFTIPGLWEGIQDEIYAESYTAFTFNQALDKFISQSDIDEAIKVVNQEIIAKAQERAISNNDSQKNIFSLDSSSLEVEVSQEVGDEVDNFSVKIKGVVNIITLNEEDVIKVIKQKLAILDFNQDRSQVDSESLNYELLSFNPAKSLAEVRVDFSAQTSSLEEEGLINKEHLVNLSEKQIRAYLDGMGELDSYELIFKPKFFKRAPMLVDRITVRY